MRLFSLIQMKYSEYSTAVKEYISKQLTDKGTRYGNSTIFGQLISILSSTTQNMMSYIEDALTEQNKFTAQRRRSVYNLAQLSGYQPSTGKTACANVQMTFMPTTEEYGNIKIDNHTGLMCSQNNKQYNIILQQSSIILNQHKDLGFNNFFVVEGVFETQTFTSSGGKLYSQHVDVNGDIDLDYMKVYVNGKEYRRRESLYDMMPGERAYIYTMSINRGFNLTFGNEVHGAPLNLNDIIRVEYLKHSGEGGNIDPMRECSFTFIDDLSNTDGNSFDGNEIFSISIDPKSGVTSGTNPETIEDVRPMIGYNSRSLVLAAPENYEMLLNRFSFVGYNRTWSDPGSLIVNSLIIKNFNDMIGKGRDYFTLEANDFKLSETQKNSIKAHIMKSGTQLSGSIYNIEDPELCRYAIFCYIKMKTKDYNDSFVKNNIRDAVGNYFANIKNDTFVPKSEISAVIADSDKDIDSVDIYILSELNERAIINGYYQTRTRRYNVLTNTFEYRTETVNVYPGENPKLGLDEHGNILLSSDNQYPVLMGGWSYRPLHDEIAQIQILDPLYINIK